MDKLQLCRTASALFFLAFLCQVLFGQKKNLMEADMIIQQYTGNSYCDNPIDEMTFERLRAEVEALPGQELRFEKIRKDLCQQCLVTPYVFQLMQLFEDPAYEYDLMRWAYYYCYDLENYENLLPFMEGLVFQDRMKAYLDERLYSRRVDMEGSRQLMADSEMETAISELDKQSSEQMKLLVAREIVRSNTLRSEQLSQLVSAFGLGKNKLDLVLFAYEYIYDPANYFVAYEPLRNSDRKKVQAHIDEQGRDSEEAFINTRQLGCFYVDKRREFEENLRAIKEKTYSKDRMRFARSLFGQYCFNVRELTQCMDLFQSDDDRLELAREAYPQIFDPWNFYLVFSHLRSQNNLSELADYLSN